MVHTTEGQAQTKNERGEGVALSQVTLDILTAKANLYKLIAEVARLGNTERYDTTEDVSNYAEDLMHHIDALLADSISGDCMA